MGAVPENLAGTETGTGTGTAGRDGSSGGVEGWKVAAHLAPRASRRVRGWMVVPRKGQIQVSAELSAGSSEVSGPGSKCPVGV